MSNSVFIIALITDRSNILIKGNCMSVIKNTPNFLKHSGLSFTTIINSTINLIKDPGALGLYCYLASKADNWNICNKELSNHFGKGRDYIRNKISILKEIGLVRTKPKRNESGQITEWETTLINHLEDHITENPYSSKKLSTEKHYITEKPECGLSRHLEKPALIIKENIKIKEERKRAKKRAPLPPNFEPNKILQVKAQEISKKVGLSPHELRTKFINLQRSKDKISADWDAEFDNFLITERPSNWKASIKPQVNELRSTVPQVIYDKKDKVKVGSRELALKKISEIKLNLARKLNTGINMKANVT